jgi:hypothetical protein
VLPHDPQVLLKGSAGKAETEQGAFPGGVREEAVLSCGTLQKSLLYT